MRRLSPALALALACCDYEVLPTEIGEHVVYHWDDNEFRLCGGTVGTVDRFIEGIADYYGWTPAEVVPGIEYFWNPELASSACSWTDREACVSRLLNGSIVFTDAPIDTHELGHTVRAGHGRPIMGYPAFINEGFASRWQSALLQPGTAFKTAPNFLSSAQLRTALEANNNDPDIDYQRAFTWWVALETSYGPAKMAAFITELDGATSSGDVELATQRAFGISLTESAALAESLPESSIDDPACELDGLPSFAWTGAPIVVDRGGARCEDDDMVNLGRRRVIWLFALEFPATPSMVEVRVTVPYDVDPQQKSLHMAWCDGALGLDEPSPLYNPSAGHPGTQVWPWPLRGRYVASLAGVIETDGSVVLPRVVFEETQP